MTPVKVNENIPINPEDDPLFKEALFDSTPLGKVLKNFLTVYPPLLDLKDNILPKLALSNLRVLILGETGTGKEMIAEAIHAGSLCKGKFVPVNCACIPSELMESEFFGHVKGAFTGAVGDKEGYVKEAEQGTLFLDEIGDMPLLLQSKLLRVLESKKYRRVGSPEEKLANFRLVTATNRFDLLAQGSGFRADIYYRIAQYVVKLPSLDKRGIEDIKLIVRNRCQDERICQKILDDVTGKSLDGNVRELINIIENHKVMMS